MEAARHSELDVNVTRLHGVTSPVMSVLHLAARFNNQGYVTSNNVPVYTMNWKYVE
jgi:hypothetical protein